MAFRASVGGIVDRVAIGTGGTAMGGTIPVTAAGMVERGVPIAGIVALGAVCAECPGMVCRLGVTGHASGG